jgi:glycosyltransferase involved in cell wall biosynthesis
MNILYIANPHSVHDIKWMEFFSNKLGYKVYIVAEKREVKGDMEVLKQSLANKNITLVGTLNSFSLSHLYDFFKSTRDLKRFIKQYEIDIVHILFATPYALWSSFGRKPYVITTRGSDALIVLPDLLHQQGLKAIYFKGLFYMFKKAFLEAAAVTSTSARQLQKLEEMFGPIKNGRIIKTGVDVQDIAATNNFSDLPLELTGRKFVFSPRYIKPVYNTLLQAEGISLLKDSLLEEYTFVFLKGNNSSSDYCNKLIEKLEAIKKSRPLHYIILNELTQLQIRQYYKRAALTIMTPISDGTPNTALEAMAAECPLIIPMLDYDKDVFEGSCMILNNFDPAELAKKIEIALTSYPKKLTEIAFDKVLKYGNRPTEMARLNDVYKSLGK